MIRLLFNATLSNTTPTQSAGLLTRPHSIVSHSPSDDSPALAAAVSSCSSLASFCTASALTTSAVLTAMGTRVTLGAFFANTTVSAPSACVHSADARSKPCLSRLTNSFSTSYTVSSPLRVSPLTTSLLSTTETDRSLGATPGAATTILSEAAVGSTCTDDKSRRRGLESSSRTVDVLGPHATLVPQAFFSGH